ncbi:hypothetical protein WK33_06880 [Burkholderia multivorans]|nr:hypothetical protein WK33_06880 [Burkholderia multivorans]
MLGTIVMPLAQRLHVARVKLQTPVTFMRNNVVANRTDRFGYAARGTFEHHISRQPTSHSELA